MAENPFDRYGGNIYKGVMALKLLADRLAVLTRLVATGHPMTCYSLALPPRIDRAVEVP
jgi:hypothetical protein